MSDLNSSKSHKGKLYRKIIPTKDEVTLGNEKEADDKTQEEEIKDESKKKTTDPPPVPFHKMFQFATGSENVMIVFGCIMAIVSGLGMPVLVILFGRVTNAFVYNAMELAFKEKNISAISANINSPLTTNSSFNNSQDYLNLTAPSPSPSPSPDEQYTVHLPPGFEMNFLEEVQNFGVYTCILGAVQLIASYFMVVCLNTAADKQIFRIRVLFLKSVLRQDIAWYDEQPIGEFSSRSIADLNKLQDGIGEKLGMFIFFMSNFVVDMVIAFVYGWKLTLVILSAMPLLTIATAAFMKIQNTMTNDELKAYSKAGTVAEEVFQSVKTVFAFCGEEKETERFEKNLSYAQKAATKRGLVTGLGTGVTWLMTYGSFSLAFWYGVKLFFDSHRDGSYEYDASTIIIVFFSALMGAMMIGQGSPFLEAINVARTGAATVFQVIHRVPTIDSSSIQGDRPPCLIGDIHFKDIHFNYPSRSEVNILNGLDFKIASGQTVALVGKSGCGKSTLIQLVQRMYDVTEGSVRIDGKDVRRFNVRWLRERIGVVGQEPVLFGMSISENIRLGCEGITQEQIELASKAANAHDFIMKMPKRYDTLVGDRGSQLSGGQKQRIAIARALVKNPRILLLDEATSALDSESEGIVQAALDKVRKGRTTLIVAHRLTTVRTADVICVINDGQVAEHGTHDDLMNHRGLYYELVQTQQQSGEEQDENEIEEIHEMNEKGERKLSYQRRPTVTSINSGSFMGRSMSIDHQTPEDEEEDQDILKPPLFRIIKLNSPEWPYILLGCFGAIGFGCTTPVYALLFGDIMGVLSITVENEARKESEFYAILFVVLGLWAGISCFLQMYMFAVAGDKLTARIRKLTFASILNQECGWFDEPKNSTGALCTRLAVDAANVQGATGSRIGILLQSFSTVIIALVFALVLVWKQALVTAVFMPLVLIATYYQGKFMMGHNDKEIKAQESCGKIASEAINNIRTVASLSREDKFKEMYAEGLIQSRLNYWKVVQVRGIIFGVSQSLPCVSYAASMWYGGYLIEKEGVPYEDVFKIAELLIFGMMMIGQSVAMAPNYNKGLMSAGRIFQLLDRKPLTTKSGTGLKLGDFSDASVEFEEIKFSYPSRSQAQILKGLNIKVENGITVALVGNSGCGKSTCVQLLERFYDPSHGNVRLGGHNINDLNVSWLRDQIGLVSQEPVLFDCSIMDNIAYGCNNRKVHIDEVIQAAKQANIHNFISALPQGYNTSVGSKGTQLSGGQKQRIAIARALLRNPKILLLDEATSALDSESEKLVQEALDKASKNRTTIIIAHRLSTIQNADCIVCIHQGQVAEFGTHQELIEKKGHYFKLYSKNYNK